MRQQAKNSKIGATTDDHQHLHRAADRAGDSVVEVDLTVDGGDTDEEARPPPPPYSAAMAHQSTSATASALNFADAPSAGGNVVFSHCGLDGVYQQRISGR